MGGGEALSARELQDFPAVLCTSPASVTFSDTPSDTRWRVEDSRGGCPQRQYVTPNSGSRSRACMHEPTSDLEGDTTYVYSHWPALDRKSSVQFGCFNVNFPRKNRESFDGVKSTHRISVFLNSVG